ncbi:MAG: hypothetical protein K5860_07710 [Bacteroidales bacterium]|nr:hypothetical protein [Bacteroidales bacterium]
MANSITGIANKRNVESRFINGKAGLSSFLGGVGDNIINKLIRKGLPSIVVFGTTFYVKDEVERWMFQNAKRFGTLCDEQDQPSVEVDDEEPSKQVTVSESPNEGYKYVSTKNAKIYKTKTL